MRNLSLFEEDRLTLPKSIELSAESLRYYGQSYKHWAIAFSGGKDSTAVVTLVLYLIETGQIQKPESLTILYADTRQELPPLHASAMQILAKAESMGAKIRVVLPELDDRFWVYILGRGVPSPSNTFRWCTPKIKVEPMSADLDELRSQLAPGERLLILTGVRIGESAARDQRIAVSCSKDKGECGQGWFQNATADRTDTLAPILHWRVCHVWDWLSFEAPLMGFSTDLLADVYGMTNRDGDEPLDTRTGCIGCPLVEKDTALDQLIKKPQWRYLAPLKKIKVLHREIRKGKNRLRQRGDRLLKNGQHESNPMRMGPLSLAARARLLDELLAIQAEINVLAKTLNKPEISLVNPEEELRIRALIAMKTFPKGWTGEEPLATELIPDVYPDGSIQPLLFEALEQ
jgi:DNA sulfur modification protein DndC